MSTPVSLPRLHEPDDRHGPVVIKTRCGPGSALVHGDYGPNNALLDPAAQEVTAILDWEWAHAMLDMAERWQPGGATVHQWQRRLTVTGSWTE